MPKQFLCTPWPGDDLMPERPRWREIESETDWQAAGQYAIAFHGAGATSVMVTRASNYDGQGGPTKGFKPGCLITSFKVTVTHEIHEETPGTVG